MTMPLWRNRRVPSFSQDVSNSMAACNLANVFRPYFADVPLRGISGDTATRAERSAYDMRAVR